MTHKERNSSYFKPFFFITEAKHVEVSCMYGIFAIQRNPVSGGSQRGINSRLKENCVNIVFRLILAFSNV